MDSLIKSYGYEKGIDDFRHIDTGLQDKIIKQVEQIEEVRPKPKQETLDSIWQLQNKLDYENTKELIHIVKSIGLANIDTLDFECVQKSFIIFVHSPNELKKEVRELIHPTLKSIDEFQYNHIMWHLDSRTSK